MNKNYLLNVLILICLYPTYLNSSNLLTQSIPIKSGWNSVYLYVQPLEKQSDLVFQNKPFVKVLTYYPANSLVQFIQDPNEIEWNKPGWLRWINQDQPDAFLKNLYSIHANQAYLILSTMDYTWELKGEPRYRNVAWTPDSFNLIGFNVAENYSPSFSQFFSNSNAHKDLQIFYLNNDQWTRIQNPELTTIQSGKAYWVYCNGGSNYNGPFEILLPDDFEELSYYYPISDYTISIINNSNESKLFTIRQVQQQTVPLFIETYSTNYEKIRIPLNSYNPTSPIKPYEKQNIKIIVNRNDTKDKEMTGLLNIFDDSGNEFFIKVWVENLQ